MFNELRDPPLIYRKTCGKTAAQIGAVSVAGAGGIEPPNGGIKIRCLTAWLRPNT